MEDKIFDFSVNMKCLIVTEHVMLNIFNVTRSVTIKLTLEVSVPHSSRCGGHQWNTSCLRFSSRGPPKESTKVRCEGVPHQKAPVKIKDFERPNALAVVLSLGAKIENFERPQARRIFKIFDFKVLARVCDRTEKLRFRWFGRRH